MSTDSEREHDLTGSGNLEPDIEVEIEPRVEPSDETGSSSRGQKKKKKDNLVIKDTQTALRHIS